MPHQVLVPSHPPAQGTQGEHQVVERENSEEPAGVKILETLRQLYILGTQQNGRNQKATQHKKQLNTSAPEWQGNLVLHRDEVGKQHRTHGNRTKTIEFRHVFQLGIHIGKMTQDSQQETKSTLHVDPAGQKPNTINPDLIRQTLSE